MRVCGIDELIWEELRHVEMLRRIQKEKTIIENIKKNWDTVCEGIVC